MATRQSWIIGASFLIVLLSLAFSCVGYFTAGWIKLKDVNVDTASGNESIIITSHGLWEGGITDLNCIGTPIDTCMPTRAFLLANLSVLVPIVLCLGTSLVVFLSGGNQFVSVNAAGISIVLLQVANLNLIMGLGVFTAYHSGSSSKTQGYGYSYYLSWISVVLIIASSILVSFFTYDVSSIIKKRRKTVLENPQTSIGLEVISQPRQINRPNNHV